MFRRLRLKGMTGDKIEFGLKTIAHNLGKMARSIAQSSFRAQEPHRNGQVHTCFGSVPTFEPYLRRIYILPLPKKEGGKNRDYLIGLLDSLL